MISLVVFTDGRRSCISRTIPSALQHLQGPITEYLICDDSADPDYTTWLNMRFPEFSIISSTQRVGFGGNIQRAWQFLQEESSNHHVFHLEDDFTFNRDVDLYPMMGVLERHPYLVQLALRRQPWNEQEQAAGGVVEQYPDAYTDRSDIWGNQWLEHRLFFTTNPSLYHLELCNEPWPDGKHSEGIFTHQLLRDHPDWRFGFWGSRDSGEWVTHIGDSRIGVGY